MHAADALRARLMLDVVRTLRVRTTGRRITSACWRTLRAAQQRGSTGQRPPKTTF